MSVKISIDLPEAALSILREGPDQFGRRMSEAAITKWYELGMVSQSKAAEILGISRLEFLRLLERYQVSACQVTEDDFSTEFRS